ncbi:MAG: dihydroorotate dehydrogenase (quinone), partial [Elusimicrobia bacterium]|nr:dihydroorotate dehydrogenase (quinone) [Elusimicrobiota bacterium]
TTISRDSVPALRSIEGGLSGAPLELISTQAVRHIRKNFGKKLCLIGVGGLFTAEDAYQKIKAGASLVQIYTGWIYGGPATVSRINRGLVSFLERDGFKNVQEAVGVEA